MSEKDEGTSSIVTDVDPTWFASALNFKIFTATMNLRWSTGGVLQQLWVERSTGDMEWRDVPVEGK